MSMQFSELLITSEMQDWAKGKSQAHIKGDLFDGDIDKRDSVYIGYLGEALFWKYVPNAKHCNVSGYDFEVGSKKIEVKANWTKYTPREDHFIKIPIEDLLRTDPLVLLCFICVNTETNTGWILGEISKQRFLEMCELRKKGQIQNGSQFKYTTHCFEIRVVDLQNQMLKEAA